MQSPFHEGTFLPLPAYRAVSGPCKANPFTIRCEDGAPYGKGVVGEQVCQISDSRGATNGSVLLDLSLPPKRNTLGMGDYIIHTLFTPQPKSSIEIGC
jgi:hypothetical protein